ncbi:MAG: hypothetical protein ACI8QZ_002641 [Chlamydiales bacterium]
MTVKFIERFFQILGSFGLACIVLLFLLLLTFLGTLEQVDNSLFEVQKKYFESLIVRDTMVIVPLPGVYLLLGLLFVNLIVGGMLRIRWTWSRLGILIIHFGIATMLLGGLIEFKTSHKGHVTLFEGESAAEFQSYFEWEVTVTESLGNGRVREHVIPNGRFVDLGARESARMTSDAIPFDVVLSGFLPNCQPVQARGDGIGIEGILLEELPGEEHAEQDIAGVTVTLEGLPDGPESGLLWGVQRAPWVVRAGGQPWSIDLRRRTWRMPFQIHLRDFTRELHPGTQTPSKFYSDVTCIQDNVSQDLQISMNEPLRRDGLTLFQASWGPSNARPGDRLFSTFAVVDNPADKVPLIALLIIAAGLLTNFIPRLRRHMVSQSSKVAS